MRHVVMAVLGGIAFIGVLIGTVMFVNGPLGFSACSGVVGCGWIIPMLAGVIIGMVLWLLSGVAPKYNDDEIREVREVSCSSCGDVVMPDWRLCPTCGSRLND